MRQFVAGFADFAGSFRWFRATPAAMRRALLPSVIVWVILFSTVVVFIIFLPTIIVAITPFLNDWPDFWQIAVRVGGALGLLAAVVFLVTRLYRGLTTIVGDVFYQRLRATVSAQLGHNVVARRTSIAHQVAGAAGDVVRGVPLAAVFFGLSLIPIVGVVLSWTTAAVISGRRLGRELVEPSLGPDSEAILEANRNRIAGFGVAANLAMLIPFAGAVAMPTAVAGGAALAARISPKPVS